MHMHVDTHTLKSEDMYSHFRAYERIKQAKAHNGWMKLCSHGVKAAADGPKTESDNID